MTDLTDPRPPLPEWIMDVYEILSAHSRNATAEQDGQSIPRERALETLRDSEQLDLEAGDATHALSRLIDRGYLYEVNDELRITEPEN
ncbi:hypothetical protein HALLA_01665 (plasmid) [Halostagnicola larsenii XH-48]|uniref:Uncharacterized protein n=1 Tax=Halostagnicola larsenii XH-48 TaxID=797299 RepID=W0JXU3_9EURY|nr:hypothetical protein [Halostagnicola larsenii]AHG02035.1 hypothetical protein HALLA_01665 [Halostagnicola larsenii XH-48]